jgi:valyl-tRNA synthetase
VIRPQLRTIPGVADVNSLGGEVRTFEVVPNPQRLAARGLALKDLQAVLEANNRNDGESIMMQQMPQLAQVDNNFLGAFEIVKEIIAGVRSVRLQKNIPNKDALTLEIVGEHDDSFNAVITKMCNLTQITRVAEKTAGAGSFLVRTTEYAVPLGSLLNVEEELAKLNEELVYLQGFRESVLKKLSNESFVGKAPAKVIEMERKKLADAESKINSLQESIAALK